MPGGLAWLGLVLMLAAAWYSPVIALWGAALLVAYVAVRFALAVVAILRGLRLIARWERIDWAAEYARRATAASLPLEAVQHVVIIPNYREPLDMLRHTLDQLARQASTRRAMTVVLAIEASEPGAVAKGAALQAEYGDHFKHLFVVTHPAGMEGEMQCKSANQAWAGRWVKRTLVDGMGYPLDHLLITTMDADTVWHPAYFEALAVHFATDPQRYATYYQAPMRYHGNTWSIPPVLRLLHAQATAWELAYLAAPWWFALPMSSYSISLRLLDAAGYWDPNVIADEWHMFIKSFFQRGGRVRLQPLFLPFLAHAISGSTLWGALRERYLQTLRHAWGAKEIGYTLTQLRQHGRTPGGLTLLWRVAHDNLLGGFGWFVGMVGAQLPAMLHPELLHQSDALQPLLLLQVAGLGVTLLTAIIWALDFAVRPRPRTGRALLTELVALPLLGMLTLGCVALPVLHAQTRLMLGMPLHFRVARKQP